MGILEFFMFISIVLILRIGGLIIIGLLEYLIFLKVIISFIIILFVLFNEESFISGNGLYIVYVLILEVYFFGFFVFFIFVIFFYLLWVSLDVVVKRMELFY